MDDIVSIIGTSALVAAIVTVGLSLVKDVIVSRYDFKRKSEAGYIQKRIRLNSKIYYNIEKLQVEGDVLGGHPDTLVYSGKEIEKFIDEINNTLSSRIDLVSKKVRMAWLLFQTNPAEDSAHDYAKRLMQQIKIEFNEELIPRYRKYVGESPRMID